MEDYPQHIMHLGRPFLLLLVAACSSDPSHTMEDPCAVRPVLVGGSAELGLGNNFAPVVEGQDVTLQLGAQGLWMFVINARARDMDVGSGDREGVLEVSALDRNGATISLELGCRAREFAEADDGSLQTTIPFALPLLPDITSSIEGAMVTLHLEVRDNEGRRATDERSVVAHLPVTSP